MIDHCTVGEGAGVAGVVVGRPLHRSKLVGLGSWGCSEIVSICAHSSGQRTFCAHSACEPAKTAGSWTWARAQGALWGGHRVALNLYAKTKICRIDITVQESQ